MFYYYKITIDSSFCLAEEEKYLELDHKMTKDEEFNYIDEEAAEYASGYGYLYNGWNEDEPDEETLLADISVCIEEISVEEFMENA